MSNKGITESVSFGRSHLELHEYAIEQAQEFHGGNLSIFIRDAIACHKLATSIYGRDWQQMENPPQWAKDLVAND